MYKSSVGVALLLIAPLVFADAVEEGDMAGAKTAMGKIGIAWIEGMFVKCDVPAMFAANVDLAHYKNHPAAADGDEVKMETNVSKQTCAKHVKVDIKKVVVSGNLVVIQAGISTDETPNSSGLTEWFRIKHGKIVDHWDMSRKMMSPTDKVF